LLSLASNLVVTSPPPLSTQKDPVQLPPFPPHDTITSAHASAAHAP
jgi:hypothetical protein